MNPILRKIPNYGQNRIEKRNIKNNFENKIYIIKSTPKSLK